jgi:hypothetical protein
MQGPLCIGDDDGSARVKEVWKNIASGLSGTGASDDEVVIVAVGFAGIVGDFYTGCDITIPEFFIFIHNVSFLKYPPC